MQIRVPPKRIRNRFLIIYELEGYQKAVNFLTEYYGVRRMKIVLDGRRVPRRYCGLYFRNSAYFTKEGLRRRIILHELYHHLIEAKNVEIPIREEEKKASNYAKEFMEK